MKTKIYISIVALMLLVTSVFLKVEACAVNEKEMIPNNLYKIRLSQDLRSLNYVLRVDKAGYQYFSFEYLDSGVNRIGKGFTITLRDKDKKLIHEESGIERSVTTPTLGIKKGDLIYLNIEEDFDFLDPVNGADINFTLHTVRDKDYETENNNTIEDANRMDNNVGKVGNLHVAADDDWFVYKIPSSGSTNVYVNVAPEEEENTGGGYIVEAYAPNKNLIKEELIVNGTISISNLNYKKGQKLYFKVRAANYGNYPDKINYKIWPISAKDKNTEQETNDTIKKATVMKTKMSGYLIDENDVDCFVFKAPKKKNFKIRLNTGELDGKKYSLAIFVKEKGKIKKKSEKIISESKTFSTKLKKGAKVWIKIKGTDAATPISTDYSITIK